MFNVYRKKSYMIALILARGGSKGVPGKNIKQLGSYPLLAYPIISAQKTNQISDVYVSTDDENIALIAKKYGAKVIERPKEISGDNSLDIEAFKHACSVLKTKEDLIHLRATTPLTNPEILDKAIYFFRENSDCTSLRSGHESSETAFKFFKKNGKFWAPLVDGVDVSQPRQVLPKTFIPNGYIDIVRPSIFLEGNSFHGDKILSFITEYTPEVDTLNDFDYIEYLIQKKNVSIPSKPFFN